MTRAVPWNCMEFHGTGRVIEISAAQVPWNSKEFHGTARVIKIGALQVPWNSMELLVMIIQKLYVRSNCMEFCVVFSNTLS